MCEQEDSLRTAGPWQCHPWHVTSCCWPVFHNLLFKPKHPGRVFEVFLPREMGKAQHCLYPPDLHSPCQAHPSSQATQEDFLLILRWDGAGSNSSLILLGLERALSRGRRGQVAKGVSSRTKQPLCATGKSKTRGLLWRVPGFLHSSSPVGPAGDLWMEEGMFPNRSGI